MPGDDGTRSRSLVFPILLISLGVLFLYARWKPAFEPWAILKIYWPLILVFVGLGKMWDASQRAKETPRPGVSIGSTIGVLAFVVVFVVLLWHGHSYAKREEMAQHRFSHTSASFELEGAKNVNATIKIGAGQLNVSGGTPRALESEYDFSSAWSEPHAEYHVDKTSGELLITQDNHGPTLGPDENTWRLRLNNAVPLELRVEMGAGQGNLKLRDLNLTVLEIKIGAGQVNVDLTGDRKSDLDASIDGGVGEATIRLPKNVGVIATAHGGIGAVTTHGLKESGGNYVNEAYGKSPRTIHLRVNGGIGHIDLTQEP